MTDRTTFGDLARVVTAHLNAAERNQSYPASQNPASAATQAQQLTHSLGRLAKVLRGYLADVLITLGQPTPEQAAGPSPWPRAAREAQAAAYKIRKSLRSAPIRSRPGQNQR